MESIEWAKVLSLRIDKIENIIDRIENMLLEHLDQVPLLRRLDNKPKVYSYAGEEVVCDAEICSLLNISPKTTYRYRKNGIVRYSYMGRNIIYTVQEYEKIKKLTGTINSASTNNNLVPQR